MKQKLTELLARLFAPWKDGCTGTPGFFTTQQLLAFANDSILPETQVSPDGEITTMYLMHEDVVECMQQLGFTTHVYAGPDGIKSQWMVELVEFRTLIL